MTLITLGVVRERGAGLTTITQDQQQRQSDEAVVSVPDYVKAGGKGGGCIAGRVLVNFGLKDWRHGCTNGTPNRIKLVLEDICPSGTKFGAILFGFWADNFARPDFIFDAFYNMLLLSWSSFF